MNASYEFVRTHPQRIDAAIHRKATARLGVAYDHAAGHPVTAAEIRFAAGNCTSIMAIDLSTVATLRDQLNRLLKSAPSAARPKPNFRR